MPKLITVGCTVVSFAVIVTVTDRLSATSKIPLRGRTPHKRDSTAYGMDFFSPWPTRLVLLYTVDISQAVHALAGGSTLDPTSVPAKWHLNPSNGLNRGQKCDRRQTDRPRYGKCVAAAIPPNNKLIILQEQLYMRWQ